MKTEFREVAVGSPLYEGEVALRVEVLRAPTGRTHVAADRESDKAGRHFVALVDGAVVGCVGFYRRDDGGVLLRHLAVKPALQKRGTGRALLAFAERALRLSGVDRVDAEARLDAMRFYEACGYLGRGAEYEKHGVLHRRVAKNLTPAPVSEEV